MKSLDAWAAEIAGYANTCCLRSDGYEEDVHALALELLTRAHVAGQRAQAEKDAEIAEGGDCIHNVEIAAAIRAAAPKEGAE